MDVPKTYGHTNERRRAGATLLTKIKSDTEKYFEEARKIINELDVQTIGWMPQYQARGRLIGA